MKESKQLTQFLKRAILGAVLGVIGLAQLVAWWMTWPVYIIGLFILGGWEYYMKINDKRTYRYHPCNCLYPYARFIIAAIMFTFIYMAIGGVWR